MCWRDISDLLCPAGRRRGHFNTNNGKRRVSGKLSEESLDRQAYQGSNLNILARNLAQAGKVGGGNTQGIVL